MKPLDISEIRNIAEYELYRRTWRPRILALKERRRVRAGDHMTFLFENRDTVRYQIQEMMRIERIVDPRAIRQELDTYNELIPGPGELSATLLVEYESRELRDVRLRELLGLEDHVRMAVAGLPPVQARFDTRQISTTRLSAVQYIKFPLSDEHRERWLDGARIVIDHPAYPADQALSPEQLEALASDLY